METAVAEERCFANHESQRSVCLQPKLAQTIREGVWGLRDRSEDSIVIERFTPPRLPLLPNSRQGSGPISSTINSHDRATAATGNDHHELNCRGGPPWPPWDHSLERWGGHGGPPLQTLPAWASGPDSDLRSGSQIKIVSTLNVYRSCTSAGANDRANRRAFATARNRANDRANRGTDGRTLDRGFGR